MEEEEKGLEGLVFVGCMFVGAGIGLAFGRPDVGGAIGMGIGFILMSIIRAKEIKPTPVTISLPRSIWKIALSLVGILTIICGILLLYRPELLYPYLVGIGAILIGVLILVAGLTGMAKSSK